MVVMLGIIVGLVCWESVISLVVEVWGMWFFLYDDGCCRELKLLILFKINCCVFILFMNVLFFLNFCDVWRFGNLSDCVD